MPENILLGVLVSKQTQWEREVRGLRKSPHKCSWEEGSRCCQSRKKDVDHTGAPNRKLSSSPLLPPPGVGYQGQE